MSATLIPAKVNDLIHVGEHGTTFGGGPVTTRVALEVTGKVLDPAFLESVRAKADKLGSLLEGIVARHTAVQRLEFLSPCFEFRQVYEWSPCLGS